MLLFNNPRLLLCGIAVLGALAIGHQPVNAQNLSGSFLVRTVDLPAQASPVDVELLGAETLCLAYSGKKSVAFINRNTFAPKREVRLPFVPSFIAKRPNRDEIYVTSAQSPNIVVVDTKNFKVKNKIAVPASALQQCVFIDSGKQLIVNDSKKAALYLVDPERRSLVKTAKLGARALSLLVAPKTKKAYLGLQDLVKPSAPTEGGETKLDAKIEVIDLTSFKTTKTLALWR